MKIVLLYSGNPAPAMLEIGFVATNNGYETCLILVDRGIKDIPLDNELINFKVIIISSPYNGLNIRRLLSFPFTLFRISWRLIFEIDSDTVVITNTIDMLAIARLVGCIRRIRIRHQVRDLVKLQLETGVVSRVLKAIEYWLFRGCELLIYSAPQFYSCYYKEIYSGPVVFLENIPSRKVWKSDDGNRQAHTGIKIGYIGIVRYVNPLLNLVDAIEILLKRGVKCSAKFAGGGDTTAIRERIKTHECFTFLGDFEYSTSVVDLYKDVDVIFAVYDRFDLNCKIAMPTKFYEAILSRIPILVSKDTYVGDLVDQLGIGLAVDGESTDALVEALSDISRADTWYTRAREKLAVMNAQELFERYDAALQSTFAPAVS